MGLFNRVTRTNYSKRRISNGRICRIFSDRFIVITTLLFIALAYSVLTLRLPFSSLAMPTTRLLTDPFLQLPTATSVHVVWFTDFAGSRHWVEYGDRLDKNTIATTTKLSQMREDQGSKVGEQVSEGTIYQKPTYRDVWRHEAEVTGLTPGVRLPYRVRSVRDDGEVIGSDRFTLAPLPRAGDSLNILLTSDHQLKPMASANMQKVVETIGQVDAVFFAGDLVNVPDRASEWFDDNRGNAFFPNLQGRAAFTVEHEGITTQYTGGAIIQSAPLFPTIGNHEVMGRFSLDRPLEQQFSDPIPRSIAEQHYQEIASQINPTEINLTDDPDVYESWLKDNTFNVDTYEELFTLPTDSPGGAKYYAITLGDVRLISLYATNVWRSPNLSPNTKGRYRERDQDLHDPMLWGYGQHIFESIAPGSPQHEWLQVELNSPKFQQAKYKIVMLHHPPHSLGDNIVPAYTDPVQIIDRLETGEIKSVRYEYPLEDDYLIRDVVPLLEASGVQLVFYGHSHIWNRFVNPSGMHFLETSNVGNTYGAFTVANSNRRPIPIGFTQQYVPMGDPNRLEPVMPSISPLLDDQGTPQPYIASNAITVFTIFNTATGTVSSYRFDTRQPDSDVVKFDEFQLGRFE